MFLCDDFDVFSSNEYATLIPSQSAFRYSYCTNSFFYRDYPETQSITVILPFITFFAKCHRKSTSSVLTIDSSRIPEFIRTQILRAFAITERYVNL